MRDFVAKLTDKERREIIASHAKLEQEGAIDEEPIRIYTRQYLLGNGCGYSSPRVTGLWMDRLAAECWRFYAMEWIRDDSTWYGSDVDALGG